MLVLNLENIVTGYIVHKKTRSVGERLPNTTGNKIFAVCPRHTAKPKKHSAKTLPSVTLGKQHTAYIVTAKVYLPSVFYRALGKDVAEC